MNWRVRPFGLPDLLYISLNICPYGYRTYIMMHGQIIVLQPLYDQKLMSATDKPALDTTSLNNFPSREEHHRSIPGTWNFSGD